MDTGLGGNFAIWRNWLFAKKYLHERRGNLLDLRFLKDTYIFNEFDEVENTYWFDFKKSKFLHNVDTFYYSVKFKNDFTADSKDLAVKRFRRKFDAISQEWES